MLWHYLWRLAPSDLTNRRRDGHPDRLEDLPAGAEALAADGKAFAVLFYEGFLQGLEVLFDIRPLEARPLASSLRYSSFLSISARKLQNT